MVIYFSSTGNCKYAAERLAEELKEQVVSALDYHSIHISSNEKLGFVFPTYFWRLPSVADECMRSLTVTYEDKVPYVYFVATYGSTTGQTGRFMKKHLAKKGLELSACYSIKTVDDWTVFFDLSDGEKVKSVLEQEEVQLKEIISDVKAEFKGNKMQDKLPMIAVIGSGFFYDKARRTKHLNVNNNCIGCGICEKECPVSAIKLQNNKPVWVAEKCAMCLHCLHTCPKFAINYDNKTQNHGQYKHP